ncbi:sensor domain-containing diguanylate cyclase [Flavobacterium sp. W21_SRS_FM6]|uniref:sensor domain-containing diguanylate cyclase n=1 Tax=Flavobacterium sp. W21_SRS_FM6 TaxID=3240268 RepID=UPI003F8DA10B
MSDFKKIKTYDAYNTEQNSIVERFAIPLSNAKMGSFISMINVIAEGIFVVNADGVIEVINPIAAKYFGNSQDKLVGQKWFHYLHDRHREHYEYIFLNWKDNNKLPLNHGPKEVLLNRADGSWLEADLSISCLPESLTENAPLFVGVVHNLTSHKAEYSELRRQASTDHLTGLANRFNLEKTLNSSWNDCLMHAQPLSLILIDVDYFKHFNDQFGHVNGDKCLQRIAQTINSCLPSRDALAARFGGEEFAIILPRSHAPNAETVARRIQQQISILNFSDLGLPANFRISVSQGIACEHNGQYRTPEALICAADTALYRAKSEGRNRINLSL